MSDGLETDFQVVGSEDMVGHKNRGSWQAFAKDLVPTLRKVGNYYKVLNKRGTS